MNRDSSSIAATISGCREARSRRRSSVLSTGAHHRRWAGRLAAVALELPEPDHRGPRRSRPIPVLGRAAGDDVRAPARPRRLAPRTGRRSHPASPVSDGSSSLTCRASARRRARAEARADGPAPDARRRSSARSAAAGRSSRATRWVGRSACVTAAVDPDAVAGLVLTASIFPQVRGWRPHPLVVAAFAAYRSPVAGEWLVRRRFGPVDPQLAVRMSLGLIAADARLRARRDGPTAWLRRCGRGPRTPTPGPRSWRPRARCCGSGARPSAPPRPSTRPCPVLVLHGRRDRLVPAAFAEAALRSHPAWQRPDLPRPRARAADGGAGPVARGGRGLARGRCRVRRPVSRGRRRVSRSIARSIPRASTSRSGTASQSAVRPNAIVPPSEVHAIESAAFSPSGIEG